MVKIIKLIAELINDIHDSVILIFKEIAPSLTDKDLHLIFMGIFGIVFYIIVDYFFKKLAEWSIEIISFVYTFTVLIVITFAIEIQQKITNRGVMDFDDILAGLIGFILFFAVYVGCKILYIAFRWMYGKWMHQNKGGDC